MSISVLVISHSGIFKAARARYQTIVNNGDYDINLVVPNRWYEGGKWNTVDTSDTCVKTRFETIRLPNMPMATWYLHFYPKLKNILRATNPQVIHLWEEPWSLVALHAVRLRNQHNPHAAIVLEVDQNILKKLPEPFETIRKFVLRNTDFILCRSPEAEDVVRKCGYVNESGPIAYGVDPTIFFPKDRIKSRAIFGLTNFTIGYAGRLVPEKGLDDVLEALALTPGNIDLAIMGSGTHDKALQKHVSDLNLNDRVRFYDAGDPHTVADFLNAIDVSILMTRTTDLCKEQFGRIIIESQACNTPLIGSTCGAIPAVVDKGGWIVNERDVTQLAHLLNELASDPSVCPDIGTIGRQQVFERYTFKIVGSNLAHAWSQARQFRMKKDIRITDDVVGYK